ncbi:hypothetical protein [Microbulbifer sp. MCCC 1A16149]|uniref:hypothetical protein n=1 Tax=Microbulbifer sp. MCCC 1A16149 TaxID=3411322 RepID=UPI003D09BF0A
MNVIVFQHDLYCRTGLFRKNVDLYREFYKGKKDLNFIGFDAKRAEKFIKREFGDSWLRAYKNCIPWAMKSDIFRVLAAYVLGGLYLDSKFAVKAVPAFIKSKPDNLHICEWHDRRIVNGIFYAPQRHPLVAELVDKIYANLNDPKRSNNVFNTTGPAVWRFLLCDMGADIDGHYRVKPQFADQVSVFTKRAFFRRQGIHLDLPNTRGTSEHWSKFQKENSIYRDAPLRK